jgi:lipopolysaccharide export system permease protein
MKKIDKLVFFSFIGPFVATFFIALFVLVMQFIWKYIDDIAGKDLELSVIAKLLFYTSAGLVPIALPLACLLSSIMTMGALGEHYELVAFKANGISLFRFMRSLIVSAICLSVIAFLFANYVIPVANLKATSLLYDIRSSRPALNIKEGVFYNGIDGYSIKIAHKEPNGKGISDILIYDHTSGRGADNVIVAKTGEMYMTEDKQFLVVLLRDGLHYQDMPPKNAEAANELTRTYFKEYKKYFDLSAFSMNRTNENLFKSHYQMMNIAQLSNGIDTLKKDKLVSANNLFNNMQRFIKWQYIDTVKTNFNDVSSNLSLVQADKKFQTKLNYTTIGICQDAKATIAAANRDFEYLDINIRRHNIEQHKKFTLSVACLLLLLLGSPLGALIRKGGLGMPLVMAVIFFVLFHVLNMTGEKLADGNVLPVFFGVWLPIIVITPIAIFLIMKAKNDSPLFNLDAYWMQIERVMKVIKNNKLILIINERLS